jgi:hypothetical protein
MGGDVTELGVVHGDDDVLVGLAGAGGQACLLQLEMAVTAVHGGDHC